MDSNGQDQADLHQTLYEQQMQLAHFSGVIWVLVKYFGDGDEVVLEGVANKYHVPNFVEVDTEVVEGASFKIRATGLDDKPGGPNEKDDRGFQGSPQR